MFDPNGFQRHERRLNRQFQWIEGLAPGFRAPLVGLRARGLWIIRVPVAILLIIGGLLAFLPILGIWMLPLGLLLLAVDIPAMQPLIAGMVVRVRRRLSIWSRWFKSRFGRKA